MIVAEIRHQMMWAEQRDRGVQDSVGGLSASLTLCLCLFYLSYSVSAFNVAVDTQTTGTSIHPSILMKAENASVCLFLARPLKLMQLTSASLKPQFDQTPSAPPHRAALSHQMCPLLMLWTPT